MANEVRKETVWPWSNEPWYVAQTARWDAMIADGWTFLPPLPRRGFIGMEMTLLDDLAWPIKSHSIWLSREGKTPEQLHTAILEWCESQARTSTPSPLTAEQAKERAAEIVEDAYHNQAGEHVGYDERRMVDRIASELMTVATPASSVGEADDLKETCRIATWMANTFYPEQEFALLTTMSGVLSQIDNMAVGIYEQIVKAKQEGNAERERLIAWKSQLESELAAVPSTPSAGMHNAGNIYQATSEFWPSSSVQSTAAEICAEMARDAATKAARSNSVALENGDEFAMGAAAQYNAQADVLREAQRRIESELTTTPTEIGWRDMKSAPKEIIGIDKDENIASMVYLDRKDMWVSPDGGYGYDPIGWLPRSALPSLPVSEKQ